MVKYSSTKLKKSWTTFQNVSGASIVLDITKQDNFLDVIIKIKTSETKFLILILIFLLLFFYGFLYNYQYLMVTSVVLLITLLHQVFRIVKEESIMVVKGLGYQITSKYLCCHKSKMIPFNEVTEVAINEVILNNEIIYVLILLTKEDSQYKIYPLFMGIKPRLQALEVVYRQIMEIRGNS